MRTVLNIFKKKRKNAHFLMTLRLVLKPSRIKNMNVIMDRIIGIEKWGCPIMIKSLIKKLKKAFFPILLQAHKVNLKF